MWDRVTQGTTNFLRTLWIPPRLLGRRRRSGKSCICPVSRTRVTRMRAGAALWSQNAASITVCWTSIRKLSKTTTHAPLSKNNIRTLSARAWAMRPRQLWTKHWVAINAGPSTWPARRDTIKVEIRSTTWLAAEYLCVQTWTTPVNQRSLIWAHPTKTRNISSSKRRFRRTMTCPLKI